jgi:hypothetical protein
MMLSRVSPSRLVSRLKDGHKAPPTLPPLSKQGQLEWAAFKQAMDGERDRWIAKEALPEPAALGSMASSSSGVHLALDRARQVDAGAKQDIEDARIHIDKFLALSHRILPGESRESAEKRRAGTLEQARALFEDRMPQIAAHRHDRLIAALCKGLVEDPACQPTLLALGQQWGLDGERLRREFAARLQSTGAPVTGDKQPSSEPPA